MVTSSHCIFQTQSSQLIHSNSILYSVKILSQKPHRPDFHSSPHTNILLNTSVFSPANSAYAKCSSACRVCVTKKEQIPLLYLFLVYVTILFSLWYYLSHFANSFISLALSITRSVTLAPPSSLASSSVEAASSNTVIFVFAVPSSASFWIRK